MILHLALFQYNTGIVLKDIINLAKEVELINEVSLISGSYFSAINSFLMAFLQFIDYNKKDCIKSIKTHFLKFEVFNVFKMLDINCLIIYEKQDKDLIKIVKQKIVEICSYFSTEISEDQILNTSNFNSLRDSIYLTLSNYSIINGIENIEIERIIPQINIHEL